ncbi:uncharacterized protein [Watersipora subatra]|uniref:uncharacterized protein isoform X2 n=1 Tax=Watersipora subatra TaxID=2589382 RepID=UPI00355ADD21
MACGDRVINPGIMPSVLLPRMCDVMVECSITIERPSQDMFTQCDLKQLTSIPGVDVRVQTEPPQKTSTSVQAMLLDLRHSDASQTVDDLDSYAAGDCVPATLSLESDQDASPQGVMAIEDKDKKWGLELAGGDTRARPSNASRMSYQPAVYNSANRDEICNRCNERKEGGQLLNCLTTAAAVALALVLFIGWYLNLSVDTHGVAFQKHNGHVGVPPH